MNGKIVGYIPTYMDEKALAYTIPRNLDYGLDKIYLYDGPYPGFKLKSPNSTDGTKELCDSFGDKVKLFQPGMCHEYTKANKAMHVIARDGYDFVIHLGSDEWITGDINQFKQNILPKYNLNGQIFDLVFEEHQPNSKWNFKKEQIKSLPRVYINPIWIRLRDLHWFLFIMGDELPSVRNFPIIEGAVLHHDDSIRDPERNMLMEMYQNWNVQREKLLTENKWKKKWLEGDYPPVKSRGGWLYWTCGCIKSMNGFQKICDRHVMSEYKLRYE